MRQRLQFVSATRHKAYLTGSKNSIHYGPPNWDELFLLRILRRGIPPLELQKIRGFDVQISQSLGIGAIHNQSINFVGNLFPVHVFHFLQGKGECFFLGKARSLSCIFLSSTPIIFFVGPMAELADALDLGPLQLGELSLQENR